MHENRRKLRALIFHLTRAKRSIQILRLAPALVVPGSGAEVRHPDGLV